MSDTKHARLKYRNGRVAIIELDEWHERLDVPADRYPPDLAVPAGQYPDELVFDRTDDWWSGVEHKGGRRWGPCRVYLEASS